MVPSAAGRAGPGRRSRGLGQRNYQRILFHSVRTASADRVRRMAAPRRHLALVCFLHQAWRDTLDQAVDLLEGGSGVARPVAGNTRLAAGFDLLLVHGLRPGTVRGSMPGAQRQFEDGERGRPPPR